MIRYSNQPSFILFGHKKLVLNRLTCTNLIMNTNDEDSSMTVDNSTPNVGAEAHNITYHQINKYSV